MRNVRKAKGRHGTDNVRIDLIVEGISQDKAWACSLEFDDVTEESFYCRPLRLGEGNMPSRMLIPQEAGSAQIAFLPPHVRSRGDREAARSDVRNHCEGRGRGSDEDARQGVALVGDSVVASGKPLRKVKQKAEQTGITDSTLCLVSPRQYCWLPAARDVFLYPHKRVVTEH